MENCLDNNTLYVKMFGSFEVYHAEKKILLGKKNNKSEKLLQIMLAYRKNGITKKDLIRYLFKDEEVADVSNSLRVKIYRLKQILNRGGYFVENAFLCEMEFIIGIMKLRL